MVRESMQCILSSFARVSWLSENEPEEGLINFYVTSMIASLMKKMETHPRTNMAINEYTST